MDIRRWGYRLKDGEIEAQIFDGDLPKGWVDSPAKCKEPKPRKVKNGDDA